MGAADELRLIEGDGGHCNLGPVLPQVLGFLSRHLQDRDAPVPSFERARPPEPEALTVTPTGQVSTSLGAKTVEDLTREHAARLAARTGVVRSAGDLAMLRDRVRRDVRRLADVVAEPGATVEARTTPRPPAPEGYRLEDVALDSEPGIVLEGLLAIPAEPGPHPAVVWMDAAPLASIAASPDIARLARSGRIVFAFHPRGVLGETRDAPDRLALGPYMPLLLRAIVVGRTLVGMRVDDTLRAIDWLVSRQDVDAASLTLYGTGAQGMVALHAAALDDRVSDVIAERALVSYRMALEAPLHRNLSEVLVPGVLRAYDAGDLMEVLSPRPILLVNPSDAMGLPAREDGVRAALAPVFETDRALGTPGSGLDRPSRLG